MVIRFFLVHQLNNRTTPYKARMQDLGVGIQNILATGHLQATQGRRETMTGWRDLTHERNKVALHRSHSRRHSQAVERPQQCHLKALTRLTHLLLLSLP